MNTEWNGRISFNGTSRNGIVNTAIWYINDTHGQMSKMSRMKTSADEFVQEYKDRKDVDLFKISAGDILAGQDFKRTALWIKFLNLIKLDASAIGNHELDSEETLFAKLVKMAKFPFVASNLKIKDTSPLKESVDEGKLVRSTVIEKNGHKYGIVGTLPIDLGEICGEYQPLPGLEYSDKLKDAIAEVQKEVDLLLAKKNEAGQKDINKIILTSHLGYKNDLILAKNVTGIDVIIGGHSHEILEGIKEGSLDDIDQAAKNKVNLVKSPNGDPVVITQAGKNGIETGKLDLSFNSDGIILTDSLDNVITDVNRFSKDKTISRLKDKALGKPEVISSLKEDCHPLKPYETENPLANLVADSIRHKSGAQVAMFNASTIRGVLDKGNVTTRDIEELFFFPNKFVKVELSEKDLIQALRQGAATINKKPELLQVSGLKYTVTPDQDVKNVSILNDDGTEIKLDTAQPSTNKMFTVACSDFLATGPIGLTALKVPKEERLEEYTWTELQATLQNVQQNYSQGLDLKRDGRIIVE